MGRILRGVFVAFPAILTVGALICLVGVLLSQRFKGNSLSEGLYFYRLDARNFSLPAIAGGSHKDWYHIGLFGYCYGSGDPTGTKADWCSEASTFFTFDPVEVFGIGNSTLDHAMPKQWHTLLDAYKGSDKWMTIAFIAGTAGVAATFLVSFAAYFSRIGSLLTWILAGITNFVFIGAAITASALHAAVVVAFRREFGRYGLKADLGTTMLAVIWIGVAFNLAAGFFWAFTICCCGANKRSYGSNKEKNQFSRGRQPTWLEHSRKYERVPSPYLGAGANRDVPLAGHDNNHYSSPPTAFPAATTTVTTTTSTPQQGHEPLLFQQQPYGHSASFSRDEKANAYEPYRVEV